jgi:HPt (histidine-containing phosphotransfer) domain-containing protein
LVNGRRAISNRDLLWLSPGEAAEGGADEAASRRFDQAAPLERENQMGFAAFRTNDQLPSPGALAEKQSPIDLVHLARQTMGDRELEKELLALFDRQAAQIAEQLAAAAPGAESANLAHKLKGSARAVGAGAVAAAAENYEHGARAGLLRQADSERLVAAVAEARAFMRELGA